MTFAVFIRIAYC